MEHQAELLITFSATPSVAIFETLAFSGIPFTVCRCPQRGLMRCFFSTSADAIAEIVAASGSVIEPEEETAVHILFSKSPQQ